MKDKINENTLSNEDFYKRLYKYLFRLKATQEQVEYVACKIFAQTLCKAHARNQMEEKFKELTDIVKEQMTVYSKEHSLELAMSKVFWRDLNKMEKDKE